MVSGPVRRPRKEMPISSNTARKASGKKAYSLFARDAPTEVSSVHRTAVITRENAASASGWPCINSVSAWENACICSRWDHTSAKSTASMSGPASERRRGRQSKTAYSPVIAQQHTAHREAEAVRFSASNRGHVQPKPTHSVIRACRTKPLGMEKKGVFMSVPYASEFKSRRFYSATCCVETPQDSSR